MDKLFSVSLCVWAVELFSESDGLVTMVWFDSTVVSEELVLRTENGENSKVIVHSLVKNQHWGKMFPNLRFNFGKNGKTRYRDL